MRFMMFPFGYNGAIVTDDYSDVEIANNVHIDHLRHDIEYFGLKYPCKVTDINMRPVCTLTHSQIKKP